MDGMRAIVAVVVLLVCTIPPAALAEPKQLPEDASAAIGKEDWKSVVDRLQPLTKDDDHEPALYWSGFAHYQLGAYAPAGGLLSRALTMNQRGEQAALLLAHAAIHTGNGKWMAQAVAAFPNQPQIRTLAGRMEVAAYSTAGHLDWSAQLTLKIKHGRLAREHLETAIALDPQHGPAHRWLAHVLHARRKYDLALVHARQAARLEPVGAEVYILMARCLFELERYDESADTIDAAIKAAPHMKANLEFERGKQLLRAARFEEAVKAFNTSLATDPLLHKVRYRLGEAAYGAANYPLAIWAFNESLAVDSDWRAYYKLGRCCYDLGQYEKTLEMFDKGDAASERKGATIEYEHWRGRTLWKLGKKKEGVKKLYDAVVAQPENLYYAQWAFHAYKELDDPFGAVNVCRLIGTSGGHHDVAMRSLGVVHKTWFWPKREDHLGKKMRHIHQYYLTKAGAEIQLRKNNFGIAWVMFEQVRRMDRNFSTRDLVWTGVMVGEHKNAELLGRMLLVRYKDEYKDEVRMDVGRAYLGQGNAPDADKMFAQVTRDSLIAYRDTGRLWTSLLTGNPETKLADPFTLLGVVGFDRLESWRGDRRSGKGIIVRYLMPGSPLRRTSPKIQPRDRIVSFDGRRLYKWEDRDAMRKWKMPEQPVKLNIRRGEREFTVTVDLNATAAVFGVTKKEAP